jgi:large subunit ribosomal protein L19
MLQAKRIENMDLIKVAEQAFASGKAAEFPEFKAGDTVTVTYRIKEGDKERLQNFRGVVIQMKGADPFTKTFTVRKVSGGIGVERIFPYQSPFIDKVEVNKYGKVRRARIFYLRDLTGKKARIKEKVYTAEK